MEVTSIDVFLDADSTLSLSVIIYIIVIYNSYYNSYYNSEVLNLMYLRYVKRQRPLFDLNETSTISV